ncbi:hypothetical protein LCGC14_1353080 [marine sediment metagenome]|uniref:Uncharacterized protein n=1 Tax=marine sediment metagenome TaxID=412755 RepID=A0A0F9KAA6_9ZZZZ
MGKKAHWREWCRAADMSKLIRASNRIKHALRRIPEYLDQRRETTKLAIIRAEIDRRQDDER